jgi:hypothetical protein
MMEVLDMTRFILILTLDEDHGMHMNYYASKTYLFKTTNSMMS